MRTPRHALAAGSAVPENSNVAAQHGTTPTSEVVDLTQADLAQISAARRGSPIPKALARTLATIVYAAAQGQRINVVHERVDRCSAMRGTERTSEVRHG